MNWQLGYTPANLRGIMEKHGLSNQAVAERTGVTSIRQVQYWLSGEKDMPLHRWNKLLQSVGELFVRRDLTGEIMNIAEELRAQANQHPLDADLEMFNVAATRIEALESALIQMADANSNWAMNMDDKTVDAIHHLIVQAQTA